MQIIIFNEGSLDESIYTFTVIKDKFILISIIRKAEVILTSIIRRDKFINLSFNIGKTNSS